MSEVTVWVKTVMRTSNYYMNKILEGTSNVK
jgi:hypothetical protein